MYIVLITILSFPYANLIFSVSDNSSFKLNIFNGIKDKNILIIHENNCSNTYKALYHKAPKL